MTLMLVGPQRVYVVVLFWHRVTDPSWAWQRSLARLDRALSDRLPQEDEDACGAACHLVLAVQWCRIVWKRLIGLSVLVFDAHT
jgi:hypothetical protein